MPEKTYLICPCPVAGCKNTNQKINWSHAKCGGKTLLRFKDIHICC